MKCNTRFAFASIAVAAGMACSVNAQEVLFDAGPPATSFNVSTGTSTLLGWSSGSLTSASLPQRWAAAPFTLATDANVTQLNVYGFDVGDTTSSGQLVSFENFVYRIYNRLSGNPAPTEAQLVAMGTIAATTVGAGQQDPRWYYGNAAVFTLPVDLDLTAGDYWLTVYAADPLPGFTDANFGWFTNAQQDPAFNNTPIVISDAQGVFLWRSASYPTPGFVRYTTTAFTPDPAPAFGPNPQNPDYFYSPAFYIVGIPEGGGCYANCDESTDPPILNVADFSCFLTKFAAGDNYANCDQSTTPPVLNVADFSCFLTEFAAGCP